MAGLHARPSKERDILLAGRIIRGGLGAPRRFL
jgi:hypothetical protein